MTGCAYQEGVDCSAGESSLVIQYRKKTAAPPRVKRADCDPQFRDGSERNLASQLPESGLMRCRRLAEISIREIHVEAGRAVPRIICPVEEIEKLEPELKIDPFRNSVVLVEVNVRLDKVRPTELRRPFTSVLTKSRNRKVALRNCPREPSVIGS